MTHIECFTLSEYQANTYVCHSDKEAVIVDATASKKRERQYIIDYIESHGLTVRHLILTHGHLDHVFSCAFFSKKFGLEWHAHSRSLWFLRTVTVQAAFVGEAVAPVPTNIIRIQEGDHISFGQTTWEVFHTPGHSPGSVSFYDRAGSYIIVGDVLFKNSIGRYDLPGSSRSELAKSIEQKLMTLPDETVVFAGHGPATTIGDERKMNPYL